MEKLTQRLADPDRLDDSREAVMAAIRTLNYALAPPGQPAIHGKFEVVSSEIQGLPRPDFTLPSGASLPDSPDIPDLSAAQSPRPVTPEIVCRSLSLGERAAALLSLTARPVRAAWDQVEEQAGHPISGRDIAAVAVSSILGDRQIETSASRLPSTVPDEDAIAQGYIV